MLNAYLFPSWIFPWSINVVALAIVFFYFGHLASELEINRRFLLLVSLTFILIAIVLQSVGFLDLAFAMKAVHYGIPLVSLVLATSCIFVIQEFSKTISSVHSLSKVFSRLGQASLVIMYMHWAIQASLQEYLSISNALLRILLTLVISYYLYRLLKASSLTRRIFLGQDHLL
jgi:fucose 4-O-acetylase-like acetyltransferase